MSTTEILQKRFWATMAERYGNRWFDSYGAEPTRAWLTLLEGHTPEIIARALELLSTKHAEHPPTEPAFRHLLELAARELRSRMLNPTRDYWRSVVLDELFTECARLELCPPYIRDVLALPHDVRAIGIDVCREMLDWACETEAKTGQRTAGMTEYAYAEIRRVLARFTPQRASRAA